MDLKRVCGLTESADGIFLWINEEEIAEHLARQGCENLTSATVSVWLDVDRLRAFTYKGTHGYYLDRALESFEVVALPHSVLWPAAKGYRPMADEALERSVDLKENGPGERAFGMGPPGVGG
ncbi:MAG: DUF3291 domain-containing protein [Rhodobacteraceae bacterium]|nr:DUF3291 domain-containing protein [Paracoccaceae bacterium]